jgi:hypothetical protein
MSSELLIETIKKAFENTDNNVSKITQEVIDIEGMSGTLTRHFYNNLCEMEGAKYLEIGSWKGSTTCAALCGNKSTVVCIDNWSEFGGPKEEFLKNFEKFKGENDATFIEKDCFTVDISTLPNFNIYMYDGNHSYDSHYRALKHFYNCLEDTFIYIVDDWNTKTIRDSTKHSIKDLGLEVLYEREIRLTWDDSHTPVDFGKKTWWNGIYVAVLKKKV